MSKRSARDGAQDRTQRMLRFPFLLHGDSVRAAWRVAVIAGPLAGMGLAGVILLIDGRVQAPNALVLTISSAIYLSLTIVCVVESIQLLTGAPIVAADSHGVRIRTKTIGKLPSVRFLPWDKVASVKVIDDEVRFGGHHYRLVIVPRDPEAEISAQSRYKAVLQRNLRVHGSPYVVHLGHRDTRHTSNYLNIPWDDVATRLQEVLPPRIRVRRVDLDYAENEIRYIARVKRSAQYDGSLTRFPDLDHEPDRKPPSTLL